MLRAGRNIARLVVIVWTLARFDALYPLEVAGFELVAKVLRRLAMRGPVEGRVGERLLDNARLVAELARNRTYSDTLLQRLAVDNDLDQVDVLDLLADLERALGS